jgi:hypothetical protein
MTNRGYLTTTDYALLPIGNYRIISIRLVNMTSSGVHVNIKLYNSTITEGFNLTPIDMVMGDGETLVIDEVVLMGTGDVLLGNASINDSITYFITYEEVR